MNSNLELLFLSEDGKTFRVVVNDPKPDVTEAEIQQAMNEILASDVFKTTTGMSIVAIKEARKVERAVEVIELV